jgi:8-oxo-dGTP diphosphatase
MDGVVVVIKRNGKYLMLKQSKAKKFPLKWMPVSGGVNAGESLEDACIREVLEETGLKIKLVKQVARLKGDYKVENLYFFTANYLSGEVKADEGEINDFKWLSHPEILKLDLLPAARIFFEFFFKPF